MFSVTQGVDANVKTVFTLTSHGRVSQLGGGGVPALDPTASVHITLGYKTVNFFVNGSCALPGHQGILFYSFTEI